MSASIPLSELQDRWARLRALMSSHLPSAGGMLIFSRLNIYYFTGSFGNGILWIPREGTPVLLARRGLERAAVESPLETILPLRSYSELKDKLKGAGVPLTDCIAVEKNGLSWALSESFIKNLPDVKLISGDSAIAMCRAVKSPLELALMREAGLRHCRSLTELLPPLITCGMSELEIAHTLSNLFYSQGHQGIIRMEKYGEEAFLGHIAAGESGNYPSVFNGPLGLRGVHAAVPHMGSAHRCWDTGEPLAIDCGFTLEGYQTDKTQMYWSGTASSISARVREAFEFSVAMQGWIAAHLLPGAIPSEIWAHCQGWAHASGWGEGFMGLAANNVHFVGHGIGLAVDEYPVLAKGFDLPLEEGMVIAVEPKLGIEGVGMIGVENTFEVTAEGGRSLTSQRDEIISVI